MTAERSEMTLDVLLDFLKRTRGFDFTGYKRSSLERRVAKRMEELGLASYADYVDHLEVHPEEFAALFNTILINVTGVLPRRGGLGVTWRTMWSRSCSARGRRTTAIRVWSAGLRVGRGGLHGRDGARRGARRVGVPATA